MELKTLVNQHKVVLFDLGGVVIDLVYEDTIRAFEQLGAPDFKELYSQALQTNLFDRYETGQISSMHFINKVKELIPINVSPNEVVRAWNAMIKDFQAKKLEQILQLKSTQKVALLSNTNDLHEDFVRRMLKKVTDNSLESYFDFTFLSHAIGMRKPHQETFLWVCEQMGEKPEDVLFIDDSAQHIEGARQAGLTAHLFPQNSVFDF